MKKETRKNRVFSTKDGVSIRWKLAVYMSFFVAGILLITWFFQVFLLDTIFLSVKEDEMDESADALARQLIDGADQNELTASSTKIAIDHSLCVMIYQLKDREVYDIVDADATGSSVIRSLPPKKLGDFFTKALKNDGQYQTNIAFGGIEIPEKDPFNPFAEHSQSEIQNLRKLHVRLIQINENESYMILLDSPLQPFHTTERTLTSQFLWISGITLLFASITVLLLYRKISAPLIRMNDVAKQLAKGKYDVHFAGEGYLETRELADTLNYTAKELSKLDRLQKELISNISHDLRTPLTMIKGYSEVMRDIPDENTPENIQVIIDETERLSALVNDLMDLSRIQSGACEARLTELDLTEAVREVLERYDTLVNHQGYRLDFVYDRSVLVLADRGMLLQVLYNLINNAIHYTGDDRHITVTQSTCDGRVRISVTDTGEGIEPEQMPLIWDRYYKVDKVHKRATVGTGLGLSIVKGILELHGAAYGVNSTLGHGSTFWFELPIQNASLPSPKETEGE